MIFGCWEDGRRQKRGLQKSGQCTWEAHGKMYTLYETETIEMHSIERSAHNFNSVPVNKSSATRNGKAMNKSSATKNGNVTGIV